MTLCGVRSSMLTVDFGEPIVQLEELADLDL